MKNVLYSKAFWTYFLVCSSLLCVFFAWTLGMLPLPYPPRPEATSGEIGFSALLMLLLSLNAGLFGFAKQKGTCPIGTKRATGVAGVVGATTLLCPVCILLPVSLLGISFSLAVLAPFIPLLRVIAILIALMSIKLLWPKT